MLIEMKQGRKKIPNAIQQKILMESGYKCANPNCRHILALELHHIDWVKDGGGNDPGNLLALCPNCHALHTKGHIPTEAIEAWKGMLVSLNNPNRAIVDLLLVLYWEEKRLAAAEADSRSAYPLFRFTGDGLGALAGLICGDLVKISRLYSASSYYGQSMAPPSFEVRLTESGQRLVKAWVDGSPESIKEALRRQP